MNPGGSPGAGIISGGGTPTTAQNALSPAPVAPAQLVTIARIERHAITRASCPLHRVERILRPVPVALRPPQRPCERERHEPQDATEEGEDGGECIHDASGLGVGRWR